MGEFYDHGIHVETVAKRHRLANGKVHRYKERSVMRVRDRKVMNLALQGAGAHGAFTWGVLDRLLNDERLAIEGISGTSSGAMNAVALAYDLTIGGRDEARRMLARLWERIGINILPGYAHASTRYRPQRRLALEGALALAHACSPYELNPPESGSAAGDRRQSHRFRATAGGMPAQALHCHHAPIT